MLYAVSYSDLVFFSWWRHQMETFSALLALCAGYSPATGEFPSQRPVTRSFDVFFDLRLNKSWSKQSWGWWFETPSRSLWRHCNVARRYSLQIPKVAIWFKQSLYRRKVIINSVFGCIAYELMKKYDKANAIFRRIVGVYTILMKLA